MLATPPSLALSQQSGERTYYRSDVKINEIYFVYLSLNRNVGFASIACAFATKWRKNILSFGRAKMRKSFFSFVLLSLNRIFADRNIS